MKAIMKELEAIVSDIHSVRGNLDNEKKDVENFTNAIQEEWDQGAADSEVTINKLLDLLTDAKKIFDDASDELLHHQTLVENVIDDLHYEQISQRAQAM